MTLDRLRVAAAQVLAKPGQVATNLSALENTVRLASAGDVEVIVFPELFISGYHAGSQFLSCAESRNGSVFRKVSEIAREHGIAICYGYPELDGEYIYNSAMFIDRDGLPLANHRKTQLYGEYEKRWFTAGDSLISAVPYQGFQFALLVCYEIEFPETARVNALAGANVILVPTATSSENNPDNVAQLMVRSRAAENNIFVVYANYAGDEATPEFNGNSIVVGPFGHVISRSDGESSQLLIADLCKGRIVESNRVNPYLDDIRLDLHSTK